MKAPTLLNYWRVQDNSPQYSNRALIYCIDTNTPIVIIEPSAIQTIYLQDPDSRAYVLIELLYTTEGKRLFKYSDIDAINNMSMSTVRDITNTILSGFTATPDTNGVGFLMQELYMTPNEINKLTKSQLDHLFSYIKEKNKKTKQSMGRKR